MQLWHMLRTRENTRGAADEEEKFNESNAQQVEIARVLQKAAAYCKTYAFFAVLPSDSLVTCLVQCTV